MSYCVVRTVGVVGDARIHCVSLDLFIFAVLFGVLSVLEFRDVLAQKMRDAMPEVEEDVRRAVEGTGGVWESKN